MGQKEENRIKIINLPTRRGVIYDRNGILLAKNIASYNVAITPAFLPDDDLSSYWIWRANCEYNNKGRSSMSKVLLVEDDREDVMTVGPALKDLKVTNRLIHVVNGEEALEYLNDANNLKPCIILLDINMPKMSGIEFLKIAKDNVRGINDPFYIG